MLLIRQEYVKLRTSLSKIGVKKSKEYVESADLILYMIDGSRPLDENDHDIIQMIHDKKWIVLVNKSDLEQTIHLIFIRNFRLSDYFLICKGLHWF